jgi:hypothetical protein
LDGDVSADLSGDLLLGAHASTLWWNRGMILKRRNFLIRGAAAAAAPIVARATLFAAPVTAGGEPAVLASAQIIWPAAEAPVAIQMGGAATHIASSSSGLPNSATPDLHCVFAKEITLSAVPSLAILHLFAFTRYRLYVNGNYIGRGPVAIRISDRSMTAAIFAASYIQGKILWLYWCIATLPQGASCSTIPDLLPRLR